ncbi:hypothetical protein [Tolypothrix sp. VBCCA 56010]|uniref:hypothetical protein n=1 Tax=Tolypothrix sp. VBCCA 56010 TaxID=3137731 RepID=UPI003D7EE40F
MDELTEVLVFDDATGAEILLKLDAIATQLNDFRSKHPHTYSYLCETATGTGDMSLGDAISALNWAANHIAEGGES